MNTEKIAEYIRSGAKPSEDIGVELEHFITDENNRSVSYYGERGVGAILERLARFFDEKIYSEGRLIALSNGKCHLTLEPAAQLEISIEPCGYIDEIDKIYHEFLAITEPVLNEYGYRLVTMGYQPADKVNELKMIPKKRYEYMDRYFKSTGGHGINMMRGTASAQVSIDYINEEDCIKKFRLANVLVPLLAFITDNAAVFEGAPYDGRMIRTLIWNDVDGDRCGIVPGGTSKDFSVKKYAEYIMNAPAILIEENGEAVYTGDKKLKDIYKERRMTKSEIDHALSMFFPDVRLKHYIEIRPADSMPIEYVLSYAALIKGIFMSMDAVYRYLDMDSITDEEVAYAKTELMTRGFDACVYGKRASDVLEILVKTAGCSLSERDGIYLNKMRRLIFEKTTLKEIINDA